MRRRLILLILAFIYASLINAQTNGTLSVSVSTSSAGGNYAPRNIVAIWIEDNSGKFVKTLLAYANNRITHLNTWQASTLAANKEYNRTDAVTGATQSSHGTRTCSWNGTDYAGKLMVDGDYKVRMELTDKNLTGNIASYMITKGPNALTLTPANIASFSSVSLKWTTSTTGINPEVSESNTFIVYPNPATGQYTVIGEDIIELLVKDLSGKTIRASTTPVIDITDQPKGIYLISIRTNQKTTVQKIIRK